MQEESNIENLFGFQDAKKTKETPGTDFAKFYKNTLTYVGRFRGEIPAESVERRLVTTEILAGNLSSTDFTTSGGLVYVKESGVDHDLLANYVSNQHIDWTADAGSNNIHDNNITESSVTQHEGAIDHDGLLNTHNLTTDIDHDSLTNFVANEHIDWTNATQDLVTTGNLGLGITPVSDLHMYRNDSEVGAGSGITIEQDGTGDALMQWLLTSTKRWVMGIDNSDSDALVISDSLNLSSGQRLRLLGGALTINSAYTLPSSDGSANKVLGTDGSGTISFVGGYSGTFDPATITSITVVEGRITAVS